MKIAIFHNYLDNIGGAEILTLILAKELNADIYTTNIDKDKIKKMGFDTNNIYSIGRIPINPPVRQEFSYWKFKKLNLEKKYNFYIIAGDWAMSGAFHNKPNLLYIHSPTREIWDLHKYTRKNIVTKKWQKPLFDIWVFLRRIINRNDVKKVENFICNSKNVQNRVKKYLNKDAVIIHPPIETKKFYYKKGDDFWLSVNRLLKSKRVDIQLNAFSKIQGEKLVIIGPYEKAIHFQLYAKYCQNIKPKNVEIINEISRDKLIDLYANCKGFIATAMDEDFGMAPVEAMASGKPIIAPNEGGYKETVINGKTGILIDNIDENKLAKAIKELSQKLKNTKNQLKYKEDCQKQAKKFDTEIFIKKIKQQIDY
jgi:glycosyltransferase involved in cell wall biosynthesis